MAISRYIKFILGCFFYFHQKTELVWFKNSYFERHRPHKTRVSLTQLEDAVLLVFLPLLQAPSVPWNRSPL